MKIEVEFSKYKFQEEGMIKRLRRETIGVPSFRLGKRREERPEDVR